MTTWAIGDIQGCMSSLERLLERIAFDATRDRLWLVGDLVNRGPRSLDVLRWARGLGAVATIVLGNHDLHLIARAAGTADAKRRDTIEDVLAAPDRDELIEWLRRRPLAHVEDGRVLVHAGLHPRWTAARARELAAEVEAGLGGDEWRAFTRKLAGKPHAWHDGLTGAERTRAILAFLIRVRVVDKHAEPDLDFDGPPDQAPRGRRPWFECPDPAWGDHTVVFGHWSSLGLSIGPRHLGLDTGCVWGRQLTAVRLDDRAIVQVSSES